jgi:acyl-coenzyme A thioesterase PaaI-like protein
MPDVEWIVLHSTVVREARTQLYTDARIVAADDPERVVGNVTLDWAILAPTPPGFEYLDPGEGVTDTPELPPLWEAYSGRRRAGGGFVIDGMNPGIGTKMSREPVLHHGPVLVLTEAAALEAVAAKLGTEALVVEQASTRFVAAGRLGPFVVTAEAVETKDAVTCRAVLRDEGLDRDVAIAHHRIRPA